ncbi:MAG TPA: holo-ACP synthase [Methylocystis sp.]|nr:holo-ACP synthase [Methylocystis sp.]
MIIGFGADLCDIRRIERGLERYGDRFAAKLFTPEERARCEGRAGRAACYAKRFAAKEACAKALGVGVARGVGWLDMSVGNDEAGRPVLTLSGGAAARLQKITPPGMRARLHLTLTDEDPYAQAMVLIEAAP